MDGQYDRHNRLFTTGELSLSLMDSQITRLKTYERVTLGIRPEHVHVSHTPREGGIPATVYVSELMGNETFVFLHPFGEKIIARAPADFRADLEDKVWVQFEMERVHFFDSESGKAI